MKTTPTLALARHPSWTRQTIFRITALLVATFAVGALGAASRDLHAAPADVVWPPIQIELVTGGFDNPVGLTSAHDGTGRLFVVEKGGLIHIVQNGERLEPPFLDISDRVSTCNECGLLGLAFPPDFAENGYFFVNYTSNEDLVPADPGEPNTSNDTVIARFLLTDDPNRADASSGIRILEINQPDTNHNGGQIVFGPDNLLYIGMGDGGGGGDTYDNAQNPDSLLGKMLRIEVGLTGTYTVPANNPFVDTQGYRDEIWATGLRNPWRFGFDRITGDLYIADVGQGDFEEISHVPAADIADGGQNFGWPILEGNSCYGGGTCDPGNSVRPVAVYPNAGENCSVTGGYVYDSLLPNQARIYLYADFCSGRLWGLQPDGTEWESLGLEDFDFQVSSFGQDEDGTTYLVAYSGSIYRIRSASAFRYLPTLSKPE